MKLLKVRFGFACGFCGKGERLFVKKDTAFQFANKHHCKSRKLSIYELSFYEGYSKPVVSIIEFSK